MKLDFVSDIACPWCAIGLHSLERALERIGDDFPVEVRIQPFELNPKLPAAGADTGEYLAKKYGLTPAQIEESRAMLRERGAAVGFTFGERQRIWNTFDAHRLLHWAGLEGPQRPLKHALLRAYHGEGRNVGDADVLLDLAREVGLDVERARAVVTSDEFAEDVRKAELFWQKAGITSVPSVVLNDRHLIQGGQSPEVFEQALRQIASQRAG